jgi:diguanylate cyclase (GGDEF)-like protein
MSAAASARLGLQQPRVSHLVLRVWQLALVGGLALLASHDVFGFAPGDPHLFDHWLYEGLEAAAAAGCLVRAARIRPERSAWLALGLALLFTTGGDVIYDFGYGGNPPFPSVADGFYLGFYPASYLGIVLLVRRRISSFNASLWLDGFTAALAAGAVGASALLEVVVRSTHGSPIVVLTNLSYPLGDIVLLALLVFVFAVSGWRPGRAWLLIGAALLLNTIGDGIYLYQSAIGSYVEGGVLDVLWPTSLILVALSAWQASARSRTAGGLERRPLFATPAACGLIGVSVLVGASFTHFHPLAIILAAGTIVLVLVRAALTFGENTRLLDRSRTESLTDSLTGIGNRRQLVADLDTYLADASLDEPHLLVVFDLNGFKGYNDSFGHPAGDALLARLAAKLKEAVEPDGRAYRMGGDEFCVLIAASETMLHLAASSLYEEGESFVVSSAFGAVALPEEAAEPSTALGLADQRLYAHKEKLSAARTSPHELLLRTLAEREPGLRAHVEGVARLAVSVGRALGIDGDEVAELRLAAELHDVGKLAIPDAVLRKPGPLTDEEWQFIHQHTLIGQRILGGEPALRRVGEIVRSTHERWDGDGYVDGLAGDGIPLASRVIGACDAFSAMTGGRPYRAALSREQAIAELRRCAGGQFDPGVVTVLCDLLERRVDLDDGPSSVVTSVGALLQTFQGGPLGRTD